ncbi:MAG: SusC/RagA family TonB-linked outer membrane protein [Chitinophagaceae bacterium]
MYCHGQTTKTVSGVVNNEKDAPLEGVSVVVGKRVTQTDEKGAFSFSVPTSATKVTFSLVGYESKSLPISESMTVVLKSANTDIGEVVVVGYGTQKRKELTGAIANISGKVVAEKPAQSFDQALSGAASGVQVTSQSGVVNSAPVFRIRGTNSISLSSYPLIIIDGVMAYTGDYSSTSAANNPLASINPNDIESIDVAKDAAATAIYGSRAANGVVFVTTKKGRNGKPKLVYDTWYGWNKPMSIPEVLHASDYVTYKNAAVANSASSGSISFVQTDDASGNPIDTKWSDYVYRTGFSLSHAINVSGGSDNTKYYFGAGYTKQEGIIKRNDFKRLNALFNIDSKINDYLSVGGKISYSNELNLAATSSGSLSGSAFNTSGLGRLSLVLPSIISPYTTDGSYNVNGSAIGSSGNVVGISSLSYYNPVVLLDKDYSNSENNHVQSNAYVQLKPIQYITLKSQYGIDYLFIDNNIFWNSLNGDGYSYGGYAWSGYSNYKRWIWTNTAQFDYSLGKHGFNALYGNEQNQYYGKGYGLNRQGLSDDATDVIQAGFTTNNAANLFITENYQLSNFGRFNYNYDGKYMLSANLRQDKYSALGIKKGTFWGISAGWDIARESFFEKSQLGKIFSQLKFRGGYGKVGNINGIGSYAAYSTFASGLYGGDPSLYFSAVGSPTLKWETSKQTNIGLSFGILNNKITGDINYYKNSIDGMILAVPQAPSTGLPSSPLMNVGSMYNKGWELNVSATPVSSKDFTWNTSFNITFNKNMVTALADGLSEIQTTTSSLETVNLTRVGYSLGYLWVVRTGGVDPETGKRIFVNSDGEKVYYTYYAAGNGGNNYSTTADGTTKYTSSSGGTSITQATDGVMYKPTQPKGYGGWTNSINYKGIQLDLLFTYQYGNYIYYGTNAGLHDQRWWNNSTDVLTDAWQSSGDQGKKYAKPIYGDNVSNGSSFPLDINVFKGDFIKLKNLSLGYNIRSSMLEKVKISNIKVYGSAQNLLFITPYPGPDPEVSSNGNTASGMGIDRNTIANARTFTVGLNVVF